MMRLEYLSCTPHSHSLIPHGGPRLLDSPDIASVVAGWGRVQFDEQMLEELLFTAVGDYSYWKDRRERKWTASGLCRDLATHLLEVHERLIAAHDAIVVHTKWDKLDARDVWQRVSMADQALGGETTLVPFLEAIRERACVAKNAAERYDKIAKSPEEHFPMQLLRRSPELVLTFAILEIIHVIIGDDVEYVPLVQAVRKVAGAEEQSNRVIQKYKERWLEERAKKGTTNRRQK
jgi:hypothetical protein